MEETSGRASLRRIVQKEGELRASATLSKWIVRCIGQTKPKRNSNKKEKKRDFSSRRIKIIRKFLCKYLSCGKHGMHELYVRKTNKFLEISEKAEVQLKKKSCSDIFMCIVFSLL